MEPHSQTDDTPQSRSILEGQLRECYVRVVYSHKTHEKCADILLFRLGVIRTLQIILSALTTAGFIGTVFDKSRVSKILGLIVSTTLLVLNAFTKDNDYGALAQKHRKTGNDLWLIRERFCSLLVNFSMREKPLEVLQTQRDELIEQLHAAYSAAPSTTSKAYRLAQKALQKKGRHDVFRCGDRRIFTQGVETQLPRPRGIQPRSRQDSAEGITSLPER